MQEPQQLALSGQGKGIHLVEEEDAKLAGRVTSVALVLRYVWDVATGQELRSFESHAASVWSVALSADGKRALSGSYDKTLQVWDLSQGVVIAAFTTEGAVGAVAVSLDGHWCIGGDRLGHLHRLVLRT